MEIRMTMNNDYSAQPGTSEYDDRLLRNRTRNTCNILASESLHYLRILSRIHA